MLDHLHFVVGVAIFFWLRGWATYYTPKYFNEKRVPGIHTGLMEGLAEQTGIKQPLDTLIREGLVDDGGGTAAAAAADRRR